MLVLTFNTNVNVSSPYKTKNRCGLACSKILKKSVCIWRKGSTLRKNPNSRGATTDKVTLVVQPLRKNTKRYIDIVMQDCPWRNFDFRACSPHRLFQELTECICCPSGWFPSWSQNWLRCESHHSAVWLAFG